MAIKQLFIGEEIRINDGSGTFDIADCSLVQKDSFSWDDAEESVDRFKALLQAYGLGKFLSFALKESSISNLMKQAEGLDAIKIYLTFSPEDKTIRAFAVASQLNAETGEFDDYKIPVQRNVPSSQLPVLENVRPCPHQCGKLNFLNKPL